MDNISWCKPFGTILTSCAFKGELHYFFLQTDRAPDLRNTSILFKSKVQCDDKNSSSKQTGNSRSLWQPLTAAILSCPQ